MKNKILKMVEEFIDNQEKKFIPGESIVQYTGPTLDKEEYTAIISTVLDGWFGLGQQASNFEQQTAKRLSKEYAVYVNSGSSANLIALETMKELYCKEDKQYKIITPAASFPTTVNPIIQLGFEPVFIDVELGTYNLIENQLIDALNDEDVIGIIYAHPLGIPIANTKKYYNLIKDKGGFLIEDCCDALDSTYNNGELTGKYSDAATLSFYAAHHITTGEGGMIAFSNKNAANIARSFRDWGRACFCSGKDVLSSKGACNKRFADWLDTGVITDHRYVYDRIGYNLKPLELQASMGLAQLKKLDSLTKKRKENYIILHSYMQKYKDFFILPYTPEGTSASWFSYPITIKNDAPFQRAEIVSYLEEHKIQTRNFFAGNLLDHPAYKKLHYQPKYSLQNASYITNNTFMIGVWPGLNKEIYQYVFKIFDNFFKLKGYH
ncbi:lipopolysaccharide biosynthesis protein RfbH [Sulfurimonas indica]|uniref:lipopolysaccharide biosynthesis protein RfbH n=1 Tax=Sulfurimonas indica TaxID=2508707 RepID=UPI0012643488|nr:lipopolysaccharide biosynthesis protein RfbH [Sulfurimonas indica]